MSTSSYDEWISVGSRQIALVRFKREWRICFVDTPDKHLTFAGVFWYGGKTLREANADAEKLASDWGYEFVGRLDRYKAEA